MRVDGVNTPRQLLDETAKIDPKDTFQAGVTFLLFAQQKSLVESGGAARRLELVALSLLYVT